MGNAANRWGRLASIAATATLGLGGAYAILSSPDAPRWTLVGSGLLLLGGGAAGVVLAAWLWVVLTEDVRPRVRFGNPGVPLALSQRENSLSGRRNYRNYPIPTWAGLILRDRYFFGFMRFEKPEYLSFKVDEPA